MRLERPAESEHGPRVWSRGTGVGAGSQRQKAGSGSRSISVSWRPLRSRLRVPPAHSQSIDCSQSPPARACFSLSQPVGFVVHSMPGGLPPSPGRTLRPVPGAPAQCPSSRAEVRARGVRVRALREAAWAQHEHSLLEEEEFWLCPQRERAQEHDRLGCPRLEGPRAPRALCTKRTQKQRQVFASRFCTGHMESAPRGCRIAMGPVPGVRKARAAQAPLAPA